MKARDRYHLIHTAIDQYSKDFSLPFQWIWITPKKLLGLLDEHNASEMCEWYYCCYGLYKNCWQDPVGDGIWGDTQRDADRKIRNVILSLRKACRKTCRTAICPTNDSIEIIIVARDLPEHQCDYLISFKNEEEEHEQP